MIKISFDNRAIVPRSMPAANVSGTVTALWGLIYPQGHTFRLGVWLLRE
ncbi:hypothetical protein K5D69_03830 [Pseudomonas cichorii]|nr:hypothetical protein [Pseudomonas cichorii]MBX8513820.1 hypothetical protein [Pseudomonas cichorii]